MIRPYIKSMGYYVPDNLVTNDDLSKIMDTSDDWIISHTGIKQRYFVKEGQNNSDISAESAKKAINEAGISAEEIDMIFMCTTTSDYLSFPSNACIVAEKIGAKNAGGFDISAACTGFIYGLETAANFIKSGSYKNILVIGTEVLSRIINMEDRNTAVLFGDGSGAAIVSAASDNSDSEIISSYLKVDGSGAGALMRPGGGTAHPFIKDKSNSDEMFMIMDGRAVYNFAVKAVTETIAKLMEKNNLTIDDVDYIIPHQANIRIIEAASKRMKLPIEKFYINIMDYANTSAASIPIAFCEALQKKLIKRGDKIITVGFGGGLTYGGNFIKY